MARPAEATVGAVIGQPPLSPPETRPVSPTLTPLFPRDREVNRCLGRVLWSRGVLTPLPQPRPFSGWTRGPRTQTRCAAAAARTAQKGQETHPQHPTFPSVAAPTY